MKKSFREALANMEENKNYYKQQTTSYQLQETLIGSYLKQQGQKGIQQDNPIDN
jgi:hypothetical protein